MGDNTLLKVLEQLLHQIKANRQKEMLFQVAAGERDETVFMSQLTVKNHLWMQILMVLDDRRAEELLLKHEDDELVLTFVSVENLHIHWVLTSTVVDTNSNDMMEMNWRGYVLSSRNVSNFEPFKVNFEPLNVNFEPLNVRRYFEPFYVGIIR